MDPFKVLGVSASSIRKSSDLDLVRQRSKEKYKKYIAEGREKDAKRVCEAFELIKKKCKFEKKGEGVSRTNSSHSNKESGSKPQPGTAKPAKEGATEKKPAPVSKERATAEVAKTAKRPRPAVPNEAAPAEKHPKQTSSREALAQGACSVVRLPSGTIRMPTGLQQKEASSRTLSRQQSTASSLSRKGSTASLQRQASTVSLASSLARSVSKASVDKEGLSTLVCACGERMPRKSTKTGAGFSCPSCRVRAMDPFNAVLEAKFGMLKMVLVQPPAVPKDARQDATLKFSLPLPRLQKWRKLGHNIEVRMCSLSNYLAQHTWPKSLEFAVNGQKVFDVPEPTPLHVRRDVPQNISAALRSGNNTLSVTLHDDFVQRFAIAIVRTVPRLPRQICKKISLLAEDKSRQRIIELLFSSVLEGSSEEVQCGQAGHDRCSLVCPITMSRIQTPARGYKCRHLQCFDLAAYLVSNMRMKAFNKRWLCPVCDLDLRPPKDMFIDTYLVKILAEAEADAEQVTFDEKGAWTVSSYVEVPSPDSDMQDEPEGQPCPNSTPGDDGDENGGAEGEECAEDEDPYMGAQAVDDPYSEVEGGEEWSDDGEACPPPTDPTSPQMTLDSPANISVMASPPATDEPIPDFGDLADALSTDSGDEFEGNESLELELPPDLPDDGECEELELTQASVPDKEPQVTSRSTAGTEPRKTSRSAAADVGRAGNTDVAEVTAKTHKPLKPTPSVPAAAITADISSLKQRLAELKGQAPARPRGGISGIIAALPGANASQRTPAASAPAAVTSPAPLPSSSPSSEAEIRKSPRQKVQEKADLVKRRNSRISVSLSEGESSDGELEDESDFAAVTCMQ